MEKKLFKSQRQTAEELITEYINLCNKYDELERIGLKVELKFFSIDNLLHWALDLIGFPQDTTLEANGINGKFFCRDYLTNSTLLDKVSGENVHNSVEEYVDFLYKELEMLKKEEPLLFQ